MISKGNVIQNPEQKYLITTSQVPRMNYHNSIVGRRISHSLELAPKPNHILRPNISTETLKKRLKNQTIQQKKSTTAQSTLLQIFQEVSLRQIEDDNPNKNKNKNNVRNSNQFDIIAEKQTEKTKKQQFKVIQREISAEQINLRSEQITIKNKYNPKRQITISDPICLHKSSQLPRKSNSYVYKAKTAKRIAIKRKCQTISAKNQTLGKCNINNSRKCINSKKESSKIGHQGQNVDSFKRQKNKVEKQKNNKLGKSLRITGQNYPHFDKFKLCFEEASHRSRNKNRNKNFTQNLDFQKTEKKIQERINSNALHRFHHAASIIQKFWKNHFMRLKLAKNKLPSFTKEYIEDIWDDDNNSSIIKGDTDSQSSCKSQISQDQHQRSNAALLNKKHFLKNHEPFLMEKENKISICLTLKQMEKKQQTQTGSTVENNTYQKATINVNISEKENKRDFSHPKQVFEQEFEQEFEYEQGQGQDEEQKEKDEQLTEQLGFDTTLQFVQDYCESFCKFITSSHRHRIQLLKKLEQITDCSIQQSSGIDNLKFTKYSLKKIQIFSKNSFEEFNSSESGVKLLTEFLDKDLSLLQEHQYFLSSLFDALNETLSLQKHSKLSKLLKKQNKKYLNKNQISQQICSYSISKILQWSSSLCGFIPESLDKDKVIEINESQLTYIRESRLALMLKTYILQKQPEMLDYGDQQHTIKQELSNKIIQLLFQQIFSQYLIYK